MIKVIVVSLLISLAANLASCAPKNMPAEKPAQSGGALREDLPAVKTGWEARWEDTLLKATKEGKVIIYTAAPGETNREVGQAFYDKYGIKAEFVSGRGNELTQRLMTERKAGLYMVDAYVSGLGTSLFYFLKPAQAVDPLEKYFVLPDISNPANWFNGLGWMDEERTALAFHAYVSNSISVNSSLVKEGEIKSFRDLLNPKWKEKIVMNDPIPTGTGQRFIGFLAEVMGIDYLRELANQKPAIIRDQRLQVEWLARGRYPIATSTKNEIIWEFTNAGVAIRDAKVQEGEQMSAGGGVVAVLNNPAHPAGVTVFVNWLLSYDGQLVYSKATGKQSRRLDVPYSHLDQSVVRQPGVKYFDQTRREFVLREPEFSKLAQEIFGSMLK